MTSLFFIKKCEWLKRFLGIVLCLCLFLFVNAQVVFNPTHRMITANNIYNYLTSQTPANLIEVYGAVFPDESGCTFQWQQSSSPLFTSPSNAPGTSTGATYTFTGPLTQTTYFRRITTKSGLGSKNSNIIKISIVSANWEDINYVREHDVLVTGVTTSQQVDALPIGQKLQSTTYMDGLGRTTEQISRETATPASGTLWGDVVKYHNYDPYGREVKNNLPYTTTTESGKYKTTSTTEQPQYYTTNYNETFPYDTVKFDKSPLNRIANTKASGGAWHASSGNSVTYELNSVADSVRIWYVDYVRGDLPVISGIHSANTLQETIYTDVNGKQVVEYTNNAGQLILKKVQVAATVPSTPYTGWICTYYVYDDFGLLRYQLQPEAVKYLNGNNWVLTSQVLTELCFQYDYDAKGRTIWKQAPGAKPLQMLYDARDRVVFMQDGNQARLATPQWTANLYDNLDRPVITALYNPASATNLQNDIDNAPTVTSVTATAQTGSITSSTVNTYKNPISLTNFNNSSITQVVKYQFYDDYTFAGVDAFSTSFSNNSAYSTSDANVIPIATSKRTLSYPTGSLTRVLETSTFLASTNYYDEKGRHIQSIEDNILGGQDITTMQYHFDGRLLSSDINHTTPNTGYTNYDILTRNIYDKIARITSIQKQFGSNTFKTVSTYDYDDMGRLKTKHLDSAYTGSGKTEMESLAYSYNIHNQITGINKDYALKTSGKYSKWNNFFGLCLGYDNKDNAFTNKQLNGQVEGQMWCTQGDDAERKYEYTYDAANRLTNAAFNEQTAPGNGWKNTATDFSTTASYDYNGNLLTMVQQGVVPGNTAPIQTDNLAYTYLSLSNKLSQITDNTTSGSNNGVGGDFKDGTNAAGTADYLYDANGNVITDLNKAIGTSTTAGIFYNYLDKPTQINIAGKGTVNFVYDANGNKLQKKFTPTSGSAITTTYINEFVYLAVGSATPSLQYINFEEGRVRIVTPVSQSTIYGGVTTDALSISALLSMPNSKQGAVDYFIRDYQQNVRMLLTEEVHTGYNTCTMEADRNTLEDGIFQGSSNEVENTRIGKPPGWNSNTSASVSKLGDVTGTPQVGPNAFLKVMAGDVINANSDYYYQAPVGNTAGTTALTQNIINSILGSITGGSVASPLVGHNTAAINTALQPGTNAPFLAITQPDQTATGTVPKAFLSVIFFDERFNYVSGNVQRVSQSGDGASGLVLANIQVPKNGYAYVYLSNESAESVYFDNFKVGLNHGRIVEENHYYAFGLKIAGISSNVIADNNEGYVTNKNLYNDKEIVDEGDLDWYDYGFRNYDPQVGRFAQMDPLTDNLSDVSPYHYAYNDPIGNTDFNGLIPCPGTAALAIFLDKAGEAISHAAGVIGPIENALSIADHIAGTASLIISANNLNEQINNWNTNTVGEQYSDADETEDDDIINVNSKTKEVQVTKTDDDFDIVGVDGAKPVKAEKGVTEALYKSKGGYSISHLYAVGMGALDNAIITLIGAKVTSWLFRGIAGLFARNVAEEVINQTSNAILRNGYYEVNGFKFSEYYFNKLWNTGRGAPSLVAKEVLEGGANTAVPDALKAGFNKYVYGGWEMIYNPATKEVWHLQPIR